MDANKKQRKTGRAVVEVERRVAVRVGVDVEGVEEAGVVVGVERECATCCAGGRSQDQGKNQSQKPKKNKPESSTKAKTRVMDQVKDQSQ